ncbi:MAG: STAS domain-containing protein [Turneriella sp.]|nr:STAS domain-containing protein [Turneriella sp.]
MQINQRNEGLITILEPIGDMGLYNLGQLRELLKKLRGTDHRKVLIDMSKVPGIDSISIGFLIQETSLFLDAGGELKLVHISASVRKSLLVTETLSQVEVFDDIPAALAAFSGFKA